MGLVAMDDSKLNGFRLGNDANFSVVLVATHGYSIDDGPSWLITGE